jgi:hypothetical protein
MLSAELRLVWQQQKEIQTFISFLKLSPYPYKFFAGPADGLTLGR